jgi:ABC-type nitrate/sulfonate/bicarbonate transport system permease component
MIGFTIAAVVGVGYGLAAGWHRLLDNATAAIVTMLQLIPGLAWIPVAILVFGIGENATIFMIVMTAFPPIAISVVNGVKRLDANYFRAAQMMGANRKTLFLRVLIPGALPAIISGLRIGLGNGWRVLVAAEMIVGTGTGLGYSIIQSRWTLDYKSAFACVGVICFIGLLFEKLVFYQLEKRTVQRWALDRKK